MYSKDQSDWEKDKVTKLFYWGEYQTWNEAQRAINLGVDSYASQVIFDRVVQATEMVRKGMAVYEQDGVCFHKMLVNYELIAAFLYVYAKENRLEVVDFGGSLGSTYFRYRQLWEELGAKWTVVEQKHFVDYGRKHIGEIKFEYSLDKCAESSNCILLSSVCSYLEEPYEILGNILQRKFPHIIIDEQAFHPEDKNMVMLQNVPPSIYEAVYPVTLFSLSEFKQFIEDRGYRIWEWDYQFGNVPIRVDSNTYLNTIEKGFYLTLNNGDQ